jgi:hypothetical protein
MLAGTSRVFQIYFVIYLYVLEDKPDYEASADYLHSVGVSPAPLHQDCTSLLRVSVVLFQTYGHTLTYIMQIRLFIGHVLRRMVIL